MKVSLAAAIAPFLFIAIAALVAASNATDESADIGPETVILRELENLYEPVPFDHKSHALMAQMWSGCETCHHRSPHPLAPDDLATTGTVSAARTQDLSSQIPSCKSCHPIGAADDIHMPGLKGAYHRQCLNCHKEWMHENACVICHKPKNGVTTPAHDPSRDDIVGRMHPPIPEPDEVLYRARFTPADGSNVLFRHKVHTLEYGISCATCHRQDNCANCHDSSNGISGPRPVRPGLTWKESHSPCIACHEQNSCQHCHYKDDAEPPPVFQHFTTGQQLDEAHAKLACNQCHLSLMFEVVPSCGTANCHDGKLLHFPEQLPGPRLPLRIHPSHHDAPSSGGLRSEPEALP